MPVKLRVCSNNKSREAANACKVLSYTVNNNKEVADAYKILSLHTVIKVKKLQLPAKVLMNCI